MLSHFDPERVERVEEEKSCTGSLPWVEMGRFSSVLP